MIIRAYIPDDIDDLTVLMEELGYPTNPEILRRRMDTIENSSLYHTFVADNGNEVVGMIGIKKILTYEVDEVVVQISALVTKKHHQRKGIGKALIQYVEEWSKRNGAELLVLTSGNKEERKKAHEFYKNIGFEITGYRFVKRL
jgi:GNAT superfamily N-acetyltransferase